MISFMPHMTLVDWQFRHSTLGNSCRPRSACSTRTLVPREPSGQLDRGIAPSRHTRAQAAPSTAPRVKRRGASGRRLVPVLSPAAPQEGKQAQDERHAADLADAPSSGLTVLVVDDNMDAAEALSMMLELQGYTVNVAHSAAEALAVAQRVRPHIALLDIGLPDLSGDELGRRLRQEPWGRAITLAAVTGWGRQEDRLRTTQAGFDAHFTKPVDSGEVLKWIDSKTIPRD